MDIRKERAKILIKKKDKLLIVFSLLVVFGRQWWLWSIVSSHPYRYLLIFKLF